MLKKLALKFKSQSLNEVRPYEPQFFIPHESDIEDLEKSDEEDEEITDINYDNKSSNNNNIVNASNSKTAPAETKEHSPFDEGRKIEPAVPSKFKPIDDPVVKDYSCSAEKRKWSQMNAHKLLHQLASGGDSSSSDDEVKELCSIKKSAYLATSSSSPPGKKTILSKPSAFTSRSRTVVRPLEGHARKKHCVNVFAECDVGRPSINFEKMQKVTIRKPHSLARPRVKIRTISNPGQRPSLYNPEVMCFRPIQFSAHRSLAPVEEPGFIF